jgi:hypothetical protein
VVIDKPQKVEIQKIDSMVVLIWPGDLMLNATAQFVILNTNRIYVSVL